MHYHKLFIFLFTSALMSCSTTQPFYEHVADNSNLVTIEPAGEKLSTIQYKFDASRMGEKRLLAILKSKAKKRYPSKQLVLFNLNITNDKDANRLGDKLRNQGASCGSGSSNYRQAIVVDKGDGYQVEQPTSRTLCNRSSRRTRTKVASVDIYQLTLP